MQRLIATALSASLLLPVLAQANDNVNLASHPTPAPQADLSVVFDTSGGNLQAIALSDKEMEETEGAFWANVGGGILGGIGGHLGYMSTVPITGQYNKAAHMASVGTGALVGATNPIRGASGLVNGLKGTALGVGTGAINSYASTKGQTINIR